MTEYFTNLLLKLNDYYFTARASDKHVRSIGRNVNADGLVMLMLNFPTDDELAASLPASQAFSSSRRLKKEAIPKRLSKGKGFGRGGNLGKTAAQRGKSGFFYVYNQRNGNRSGRCFGNVRGKAIGSFADRHTCARAVDDYIRKMGFIDLPLNFPNEEDLRLRAERMMGASATNW